MKHMFLGQRKLKRLIILSQSEGQADHQERLVSVNRLYGRNGPSFLDKPFGNGF